MILCLTCNNLITILLVNKVLKDGVLPMVVLAIEKLAMTVAVLCDMNIRQTSTMQTSIHAEDCAV